MLLDYYLIDNKTKELFMNKQIKFKLSILFGLILLSSCVRDGENLDECIRRIRIELRWMDTQPLDNSERVNIEIVPTTTTASPKSDITSDIYGVDLDLLTGGYAITGWESYTDVDLNKTDLTVGVHTLADGTAMSPAIFSAGHTNTTVEMSNESLIIPLPMYRQVRPVVIEINFIGDAYSLVNGVTGTLKNIALERSLDNAFPPVNALSRPAATKSGNMNYTFGLADNIGSGIWYTGTKNLIGIDGNSSQTLDLTVSFTGDNQPATYAFDVTGQLNEYHTKKINEPWYIILTLNLGATLDITIVDWIAGPESWIVAH